MFDKTIFFLLQIPLSFLLNWCQFVGKVVQPEGWDRFFFTTQTYLCAEKMARLQRKGRWDVTGGQREKKLSLPVLWSHSPLKASAQLEKGEKRCGSEVLLNSCFVLSIFEVLHYIGLHMWLMFKKNLLMQIRHWYLLIPACSSTVLELQNERNKHHFIIFKQA